MRGHQFFGRTARAAAAAVLLGLVVVAFAAANAPAATAAKGACGTVPTGKVNAPASLLNSLPADLRAGYTGLPFPIRPSAYVHWKPQHKAPWTIGIVSPSESNASVARQLKDDQDMAVSLKKHGLLKKLIVDVDSTNAIPTQIQQMQSLIQQKVDLILLDPVSATALLPSIQAARKAGIAVVAVGGLIDSPDVVNVDNSPYLFGGVPAAYMAAHELGGKGNVILVEGIPTNPNAVAQLDGAKAAFALCPGIKIVTTLIGNFAAPVAKSAMLQYLTTNPTVPIAGVWDGGVMSLGELSAFQQLARTHPRSRTSARCSGRSPIGTRISRRSRALRWYWVTRIITASAWT